MEEEAFIWWRSLTANKKKRYVIIYSLPNTWVTRESDISFEILTKVYKKVHKIKKESEKGNTTSFRMVE